MRVKALFSVAVIALVSLLASGCYYNKKLVYLKDNDFTGQKGSLIEAKRTVYKLQSSDIIAVQVKGPGESQVSGAFNLAPAQGNMFATPGNFYMDGYTIDSSGKITLPVIGAVTVRDLTVEEAQQTIQELANKYLTKAIVIVKLTSFKITVLGEVKNPGYYYVYNTQATILEGLGMAGDLTTYGNRQRVKLIRQAPGGSEVALIDLTDARLLQSNYYFMMPGDVLYVEPLRARSSRSNLDLLTVLFTAATTTVLILSYINSNSNK